MNMRSFYYSILISEVKDIESHVLQALEKAPSTKTLKFHLEFNFKIFQKQKRKKRLQLIGTTFLPLELTLLNSMST